MSSRDRLLLTLAAVALAASAALACGPDFPWQLLDNRAETLRATPVNGFTFEVRGLVPPPHDGLRPVELPDPDVGSLEHCEALGLSLDAMQTVSWIRVTAETGDAAFEMGAALPPAVRLYTAGAVDFHHGAFAAARERFAAILALPERDRWLRTTWAAYMLGRLAALDGDVDAAAAQFATVRTTAIAGAPDPLGLGVASFGEEARAHFVRAAGFEANDAVPAERVDAYRRAVALAVTLYAEQAAHGSESGRESLVIVARYLLARADRLEAVVPDTTSQRMLVAYVLADQRGALPADRGEDSSEDGSQQLAALVDAMARVGGDRPEGADRLAALAYGVGRYDLARRLVAEADGALASWVAAKLALQTGDLPGAAAFYAKAIAAFPVVLDDDGRQRVQGEAAVLDLARGEYVTALRQLHAVGTGYWGDLAYVAERVLTVDELKGFVDAEIGAAPTSPMPTRSPDAEDDYVFFGHDVDTRLRTLLARRLVRAGRYDEAARYFPPSPTDDPREGETRARVADYARALRAASGAWWTTDRARAWFEAAVLARTWGMEMMGYDGTPDFAAIGGEFAWGVGQSQLPTQLVTGDERARFAETLARPNRRFHYRWIAVEHALAAAALVPPRSQAFAAILCRATGWMLSTRDKLAADPDVEPNEAAALARRLYQRYVAEGPSVPWATHFGHDCPEPDFDGAARLARANRVHAARLFVRRHRPAVYLAIAVFGVAGLAALAGRRRAGDGSTRG